MAVDESSSQDSTLIDDDLVAALGFEPVTTIDDTVTEQANGNGHLVNDITVDEITAADDLGSGDLGGDDLGDVLVLDEAPDAAVNGYGIDEIQADEIQADDAELAPADLDDSGTDDSGVVEAEATQTDAEVDVIESDVIESDVIDSDVTQTDAEVDVADEPLATGRSSFFDLESDADGITDLEVSDLDNVPSIADDSLQSDATAPVGVIDLALDDDVAVEEVAVEEVAVDEVADDSPIIDLDSLDVTDAAVEPEVHGLADADSVFADATPVLDPPVFDDAVAPPVTETVGRVDAGLLDLDAGQENVGAAAVAPAVAAAGVPNKRRRRLRARKSRRVIRHIDPWSVLTFSVLFHMVVFASLLLASVLVWNAAIASGMVENVESFIQELGDYETFEINADVMFKAAIVIAGMLTLASSVLVVLLTVVFNLISDLVGGIRVTVIEEETVRVPIDKKRRKA